MAQVFIVEGLHWSVPGKPMTAHATKLSAEMRALELVNAMLGELKRPAFTSPRAWSKGLNVLRRELVKQGICDRAETANVDVWITPLDLS
jgi:hypothetical protein